MPFTLLAPVDFVQDIKKSRFIGQAAPISGEEEAKAFLAKVSDPAANHNCWAWRIGQAYRFSDDGEPSGTAGKPILQAIDGQDLDGVMVVVTRFFGGILLGSGGLMRAYGGTAAQMLRAAEKQEIIPMVTGECALSFSDLALVRARLSAIPHLALAETFTAAGVDLVVTLRKGDEDQAISLVRDLTSGRSQLTFPD
ncbi:IMPACT family protein [Rhizobium rosettiformans]|uniref:IMPACT family protein n=1 Tax=Rhizobium rosettiformans TaxID=1368430 RepID=UPI00285698DF|nr:YigZ family protein [Rhizobium rosettiformans]MDR7028141.1 putative YigZ family protein [Rhizobium rosettiformans]MDR7064577.1 putative YigZ family protein [Rhizobium rosettiformans]